MKFTTLPAISHPVLNHGRKDAAKTIHGQTTKHVDRHVAGIVVVTALACGVNKTDAQFICRFC